MHDVTPRATPLSERSLSYGRAGETHPESDLWSPRAGDRHYERTVRIGAGEACWRAASTAVTSWEVKTRSGFEVEPAPPAGGRLRIGERYWLIARAGPLRIREPVQVTATVYEQNRQGFAYGTLDGHPVAGEEAFIVHRTPDGAVLFTLRSVTEPGSGPWRAAFPAVLVAQRMYRRRYLRALAP